MKLLGKEIAGRIRSSSAYFSGVMSSTVGALIMLKADTYTKLMIDELTLLTERAIIAIVSVFLSVFIDYN